MTTLQALVLSCSPAKSPAKSSSELIGRELLAALADPRDTDLDGTAGEPWSVSWATKTVHIMSPPRSYKD